MWMRYRHKFSSGISKIWSWRDLGDVDPGKAKEYAKDECAELSEEYHYSEHYRGIDYEIVDLPPADVVKNLATEAEDKSRRWAERAAQLRGLL